MRPLAFWIALRSSLWFVPTVVVLGSMALGHGLVELGARVPAFSQQELPSIFGFSVEGSRAMLSAMATAMITVAGVAFSITIVTLSLASSQYSPRVLRQFMRDRANQWVLGVFVGIFAFCLTVLPRVRGGDDAGFVPAIAVAAGVVYSLVGVGCLIFFIHHVATSIQASYIVAQIAAETRVAADAWFPVSADGGDQVADVGSESADCHAVLAAESGYIQLFDQESLLELAAHRDLVVRMEHCVGDFVVAGTPLASVCGNTKVAAEIADTVQEAFTISRTRTLEQDVMFGVRQIVDIALRALSPSLNDPTTAILCVDYLTTILRQLAGRRMGPRQCFVAGKLRLVARHPAFSDVLELAFGEVRANAGSQVLILRRIMRGLDALYEITDDPQRRRGLAEEAKAANELLRRNTCDPVTRQTCHEADRLLARFADSPGRIEGGKDRRH